MTFTEEDAKNDGLIKDEAGTSMKQVAARENSELYQYYTVVCENMGIGAGTDLADMAVKALESDDFANTILGTQVDLRKIRANEIRVEDMKQVKELYDEFNNDEGPSFDIENIIEQRLEQKTQGPLSARAGGRGPMGMGGEGSNDQEVQELRQEVRRLQKELEQEKRQEQQTETQRDESPQEQTVDMSATSEDDVDELFSDDEPQESEVKVTEVAPDAPDDVSDSDTGNVDGNSERDSVRDDDSGEDPEEGGEEDVNDEFEPEKELEEEFEEEGELEDEFEPEEADDEQ
jgi:hypothetical protein